MEWRIRIVPNAGKYLVEYQRRMRLPVYQTVHTPGLNGAGEPMMFSQNVVTGYEYTKWYSAEGIKSFYQKGAAEDWMLANEQQLLKGKNNEHRNA